MTKLVKEDQATNEYDEVAKVLNEFHNYHNSRYAKPPKLRALPNAYAIQLQKRREKSRAQQTLLHQSDPIHRHDLESG